MRLPRVLFLAVVGGVSPRTASAQPAPRETPSEWLGGGGLLIGVPLGDFADATDEGFGVAGNVVFSPGGGPFGIRFQTGGVDLRQPGHPDDRARDGRARSPRTSRSTTGC